MNPAAKLLLLFALFGSSSCTVHHHHYPDATPDDVVAEPDEPWSSEAGEDGVNHAPEQVNIDEPEAEADRNDMAAAETEEPVYVREESVPAVRRPSRQRSVLKDCDLENHDSGWVIAECPDAALILQTGPSTLGPLYRLFSYAGEVANGLMPGPTTYFGDRGSVTINGRKSETSEFVLREMKKGGFGGTLVDSSGRIAAQGVYTILQTQRGKTGVLCMQQGQYSRTRCLSYFKELVDGPMSGIGVEPGDEVEVAGVRLKSSKSCHFSRPGELGCPSGSLYWNDGSHGEIREQIANQLEKWTDDHGIEGFHNPHIKTSCVIAGQTTTCHEVRFQGVLDTPAQIYHIAQLDRGEYSTVFGCTYSTSDPIPEPCQRVFKGSRKSAHVHSASPARIGF